jgi:hypothetical protein
VNAKNFDGLNLTGLVSFDNLNMNFVVKQRVTNCKTDCCTSVVKITDWNTDTAYKFCKQDSHFYRLGPTTHDHIVAVAAIVSRLECQLIASYDPPVNRDAFCTLPADPTFRVPIPALPGL